MFFAKVLQTKVFWHSLNQLHVPIHFHQRTVCCLIRWADNVSICKRISCMCCCHCHVGSYSILTSDKMFCQQTVISDCAHRSRHSCGRDTMLWCVAYLLTVPIAAYLCLSRLRLRFLQYLHLSNVRKINVNGIPVTYRTFTS